MKSENQQMEISDRRLILAIDAKPLNGLAQLMRTNFVSTKDLIAEGIIQDHGQPLLAICEMLADCGVWCGPRRYLETDDAWRQLIPYVVIKTTLPPEGDNPEERLLKSIFGDPGTVKYLTYRRAGNIEEQRLAGRMAIGWGGHVDLPDLQLNAMGELSLYQTVLMSTARELEEEVGMTGFAADLEVLGLIISDDETGRVHVGLVLVVEGAVTTSSKEDSQLELEWLTANEIIARDGHEGWTTIVAQQLARL